MFTSVYVSHCFQVLHKFETKYNADNWALTTVRLVLTTTSTETSSILLSILTLQKMKTMKTNPVLELLEEA